MSQLSEFRKEKDDFMQHSHQSPLTAQQKANFSGLNYFEENPELRLELEVEAFKDQNEVTMQTSTGSVQTYIRYGRFKFDINGDSSELTLFSSEHGFFLPFVDSQAGEDTYGAGRYLDPPQLANGKFDIDFNVAYNPYCAYNENYSCPLPPGENRVSVAIQAGEKSFKDE